MKGFDRSVVEIFMVVLFVVWRHSACLYGNITEGQSLMDFCGFWGLFLMVLSWAFCRLTLVVDFVVFLVFIVLMTLFYLLFVVVFRVGFTSVFLPLRYGWWRHDPWSLSVIPVNVLGWVVLTLLLNCNWEVEETFGYDVVIVYVYYALWIGKLGNVVFC